MATFEKPKKWFTEVPNELLVATQRCIYLKMVGSLLSPDPACLDRIQGWRAFWDMGYTKKC